MAYFNRLMATALGLTTLLVFQSCTKSSDEVTYIPVQLTDGGAWTFIDSKGERVGSQEWEFEPTVTLGQIFTAQSDSGLTVYRWHGNEAKPIDSLQNLVSVGVLSEGLLPVTPAMQRIRIVDTDGDTKFILEPIDGQEIGSCANQFKENRLIVSTINGKAGVIDNNGNVIVKPKYSAISDYNGGYALAVDYNYDKMDAGPTYYVLDIEGNVTNVKGKFGYSEGDCEFIPEFEGGLAVVNGEADTTKTEYTPNLLAISTDGTVTPAKDNNSTTTLDNGAKIVTTYNYKDYSTSSIWYDKEGKEYLKTDGKQTITAGGQYVMLSSPDESVLYDQDGRELNKFQGQKEMYVPGGKFGPVLVDRQNSPTTYTLLTPEGQSIEGLTLYGVGIKDYLNINEDEINCETRVTSAYVDITAAATKLVNMIRMNMVKGKDSYYLGQSIADILSGENARFYNGKDRTISIPTDSTGSLGSGAGFWINGTAKSSANIVAPVYQHYFEVHHYDYWGTAWGWNRQRQVGVKFNPAAKVQSFDIQLHTNHASGSRLREAIGRRLKTDGYTAVTSTNNYDEYSNGTSTIIIYGTRDSRGVGAILGAKAGSIKDSDKATLAASIF